MMVTYKGTSRRGETSDYVVVAGQRFDSGVEVEASDDVVEQLRDLKGYKFEFGEGEGAQKEEPAPEARQEATEPQKSPSMAPTTTKTQE